MEKVWLIDATSYEKDISKELLEIKKEYFLIKSHVRKERLGNHILPTQKTFSNGLLRIATLLDKLGCEVQYYHLRDFVQDKPYTVSTDIPDIVAFSCVCPTIPICSDLSYEIKQLKSDIITVVGGAHINVALETTKKQYTNFDRYSFGYDKQAIEGILGRSVDLCMGFFPYADYSLLPYPLAAYDINVFSTLGCPFHCEYCQDGSMPYYENRLDGGLQELIDVLPPKKLIHFFDSTLGYSKNRLIEVCNTLSTLNHPFLLSCDIRGEFITEEVVYWLEKAGFREIRMGLETVDENVLKKNSREITPNTIWEKIDIVRKYSDLYLSLYTVSGIAGYTEETYEMNKKMYYELLSNRTVDEIKNAQYVPYPRDGLDFSKKGIYIRDHEWKNYDRQSFPVYDTDFLSRQQMWDGFLGTARAINKGWLKGYGFQNSTEIKDTQIYPEYIVQNYLEGGK